MTFRPSSIATINIIIGFIATTILFQDAVLGAKTKRTQPLCANDEGIFVGLAIDENAYDSIPGSDLTQKDIDEMHQYGHYHHDGQHHDGHDHGQHGGGNDDGGDHHHYQYLQPGPAQKWTLTQESNDGPQNSFGGQFLQVLPDTGRRYPAGHGKHITSLKDLDGDSPHLSFKLNIKKGEEGWHTLFVRWTGGDNIGGGDSFYVTMKQNDKVIPGERTIKPAVEPIGAGMKPYAGCCYDYITHACPCFHEKPDNSTCEDRFFVPVDRAITFDKQCPIGQGIMDILPNPEWYLFSGQLEGNVMDFEEEPWDTTCEANGMSTADSGHDFPSWYLEKSGVYELQIYAREDGTALDGIYLVGPKGIAPGITHKFTAGDSSICPSGSVWKTIGLVCLGLGLVGAVAFFAITEQGQHMVHQGRMMIGQSYNSVTARQHVQDYEEMGQLEVNFVSS